MILQTLRSFGSQSFQTSESLAPRILYLRDSPVFLVAQFRQAIIRQTSEPARTEVSYFRN